MNTEIAIMLPNASKKMAILRINDNISLGYRYLPAVNRSIRYSGRPSFVMLFWVFLTSY